MTAPYSSSQTKRISLSLIAALTLASITGRPSHSIAAEAKAAEPESAEAVVDLVEKTLQDLPAYSCVVDVSMKMTAKDMNNEMDGKFNVRVEKPRRWAIVQQSGQMGGTTISDGKEITTHMPILSKYSVDPLPDDWEESETPSENLMLLGPAAKVQAFMGRGFKDMLMEGVKESKLVGVKKVGKQPCWHCTFQQDGLSWELWVQQSPRPLLRRIKASPDMSAQAERMGDQFKDLSMVFVINFKDWQLDPKFTDEDFKFDPPAGAKKVDSLLEGMGGSDEPHPLVGEPAPTFELDELEGESFNLEDVLGKKVVVLDFWATWCGPCVRALPEVTAAAEEMKEKGVVFYAVNLREEADDVREFLKEKELKAPVLLDPEGAVGDKYQANAIPQTVLIGKDGRVQVVHVGFGPGGKKALIKELTALVDGEDLAAKTLEEFKNKEAAEDETAEVPSKPNGLREAWTAKGSYQSVAVDYKSGLIYALQRGGIVSFNAKGEQQETFTIKADGTYLRLANLTGDAAPEFLLFNPWGQQLVAVGRDGKKLWDYPGESGIDDVWATDLDGDETGEVIIGFNGGGGLHVLKPDGEKLWSNNSIGNVWHVSAGPLQSEDDVHVVSTSAQGQVHIFDRQSGEQVEQFDAGLYANYVRIIPTPGSKQARAVVTGTGDDGESMALLNGEGEVAWTVKLPGGSSNTDSVGADVNGALIVVGQRGGVVSVHDSDDGELLGLVGRSGQSPSVAIAKAPGRVFLVLVATGKSLVAYYNTPMDEPTEESAAEDPAIEAPQP